MKQSLLILMITGLLASLPLSAEPAMKKGGILADSKGMTLYTFDKDSNGKSACKGECLGKWPVFSAPSDAKDEGDFTVITREDGSKQWAYKGKPLYYFVKDKKAGEKHGDNVKNVWHVVK